MQNRLEYAKREREEHSIKSALPLKSKEKIANLRKILRQGANGLRNEVFFFLGINTAFKVGELLTLKVEDVLASGII